MPIMGMRRMDIADIMKNQVEAALRQGTSRSDIILDL